jgi:UDP-3-O-[3-hydroxymyristoyl] glucosamine N-acyltransferase
MTPIRTSEVAELCRSLVGQAELQGNSELVLTGINLLEEANATELSFVANRKAQEMAAHSKAGCLLVPIGFVPASTASIQVADPRGTFAQLIARLFPVMRPPAGVHATAIVDSTAVLSEGVSIGAHVTVGSRSRIGAGCAIEPGCHIGADVVLGEGSRLFPSVTVYERVRIGARAILHSGCVIGADGFGFAFVGDHYEKFPQIGSVEIGDDVELGANTCVDRAALGVTRIGDGTKLDNMVHIAHNCQIGRHVVIAAQTGLSGGVHVGDYAVIGGQVGVGDKARIESRAVVGSGAGILTAKIVRGGQPVWGTPARPLKEHLLQLASLAKLPELRAQFRELANRVDAMERGRGPTQA